MKGRILWMFALFAILAPTQLYASVVFYSINVHDNTDEELVRVNAVTGQVASVATLNTAVQLKFPSLAMVNGRLFAAHSNTVDPVQLLELNTSTGAVLSSTSVTVNGASVPLAEGFDSTNGKLVVSYKSPSVGSSNTRSKEIGTLRLDGVITDSITLSQSDDLDGLAVNNQGEYFGSDAASPRLGSDILSIQLDPPATTLLNTIGSTYEHAIVDLAFADTGLLFGLDKGQQTQIHRIDPATGQSLGAVSIDPSWNLRGMAFDTTTVIPEPASVLVWTLLAMAFVARWLRR